MFHKGNFDKLGANVDDKLNYIELLFHRTGQIWFDIEYLNATGAIYVRTGPNSNQVEEILTLARYLQDELAHLWRACVEILILENKVTVDQNDGPAKQDKELRLKNINKVKESIDD